MIEQAHRRDSIHFEVKQTVYSCMETGQFNQAGIIMQEYAEVHPAECEALRVQLVRDYGKEV